MDNLNLAARLVALDWNHLFEFYGAIFASFACVVTMFSFLLLDEVLAAMWEGYMQEEWEQAREGQVSLTPLPVIHKSRVFYRNEREYVAFCDELAFSYIHVVEDQGKWAHINEEEPLVMSQEINFDSCFEYV